MGTLQELHNAFGNEMNTRYVTALSMSQARKDALMAECRELLTSPSAGPRDSICGIRIFIDAALPDDAIDLWSYGIRIGRVNSGGDKP